MVAVGEEVEAVRRVEAVSVHIIRRRKQTMGADEENHRQAPLEGFFGLCISCLNFLEIPLKRFFFELFCILRSLLYFPPLHMQ